MFCGPQTGFGYTPIYRANGFQFFLVSLMAFLALVHLYPNIPLDLFHNFQNVSQDECCHIYSIVVKIFLLSHYYSISLSHYHSSEKNVAINS